MTYKPYFPKNHANNQYSGHCNKCGNFEALSNEEGLCYKCIVSIRNKGVVKNKNE